MDKNELLRGAIDAVIQAQRQAKPSLVPFHPNSPQRLNEGLEFAAQVADEYARRYGIVRSLKGRQQTEAAKEIAKAIRSMKVKEPK